MKLNNMLGLVPAAQKSDSLVVAPVEGEQSEQAVTGARPDSSRFGVFGGSSSR